MFFSDFDNIIMSTVISHKKMGDAMMKYVRFATEERGRNFEKIDLWFFV